MTNFHGMFKWLAIETSDFRKFCLLFCIIWIRGSLQLHILFDSQRKGVDRRVFPVILCALLLSFPFFSPKKVGSSCISTALKKGPTNFDMFSKLSYWWDPKNSLWTGKRGLFSALRCYTTIKRFFYSSPLSGLTLYKWEFSESGTLIGIPLIRRHVLLLKWPPLKASFNLGGQLILLKRFFSTYDVNFFQRKRVKEKIIN